MAVARTMTRIGSGLGLAARAALIATLAAGCSTPIAGCDSESPKSATTAPTTTKVTIAGKTFELECALTDTKRFKGLSDRTDIPADKGMIFVFRTGEERYFVMRDCPVDIDIVYLDARMKVTATHAMKAEAPRAEDEKVQPGRSSNDKYENRLKRYHSKFPAMYVLEFKGGTLEALKLKEGDKVEIDPDLKKWAQ